MERREGLRPPPGTRIANVPAGMEGRAAVECPGGLDFANPDFAITFRMTSIHDGESRYYHSSNRGRDWQGPCNLPNFGQPGIAARTDYLISGGKEMLVMLTAAKSNRREGLVIAVRARDGGKLWHMLSFIGPEPEDFAIVPSSVRVGPGDIVTAIRRRRWIDVYRPVDDREPWRFRSRSAKGTRARK
ncbi:MAG: hypothetical protein SFV51_17540 [Bryobacteraceae bacterium]|nr:hypothetical protein [Bryobacteraceae bacterium]